VGDEAQRPVKLYLDHDISYRFAEQLRARGYDAIGAWEVGNARLSDPVQLEYAAGQGRVLVTCNAQDFAPLYLEWWSAGRHHSGIVTSEQLEFGEMLRRLICFLESVTAGEMRDMIRNLAEFKESRAR
jgi:predicted nuclease of predicted toxin-antitoxin system